MLDKILSFIADKLNWSGFNYTWDVSTNNTSDTWVPVFNGNLIQHRVEADWIVDGGWKDFGNYRWMWKRWNKGVQELDLIWQFTNSPYSTWNNMNARKAAINWGSDIGKNFIDTWYEITQHWEVGSGFAIPATVLGKATNKCECFGLSSIAGSQTCRLSAHIVGRWK